MSGDGEVAPFNGRRDKNGWPANATKWVASQRNQIKHSLKSNICYNITIYIKYQRLNIAKLKHKINTTEHVYGIFKFHLLCYKYKNDLKYIEI